VHSAAPTGPGIRVEEILGEVQDAEVLRALLAGTGDQKTATNSLRFCIILSLHKVAFFIYLAFIHFICFNFYTKLPDENQQEDLSHKVAVKADHPGS